MQTDNKGRKEFCQYRSISSRLYPKIGQQQNANSSQFCKPFAELVLLSISWVFSLLLDYKVDVDHPSAECLSKFYSVRVYKGVTHQFVRWLEKLCTCHRLPRRGDPGLMWGNTGTLWGLCNKFLPLWWGKCGDLDFALLSGRTWGLRFCSTERRLGIIDCSLNRWQDSPDRFKTESREFRTGRKVEIFTRLRAAKVVFKKNYLKFNFHQSEC